MKPGWADIGRYYLIVRLEEGELASEYMITIAVINQKAKTNGSTNADVSPNHNDNKTSNSSLVDKPDANLTSFSMRISLVSP